MKGLIYSEPADRWRLVRDRKGTSLVLTHSPTKTVASSVENLNKNSPLVIQVAMKLVTGQLMRMNGYP